MAAPSAGGGPDLVHRLEELETRLRRLEACLPVLPSPSIPEKIAVTELSSELSLQDAERFVPLMGKALLGLAGAYLLRALATSSLAPSWAGVALALCYAGLWMFWATRMGASNPLSGAVYMTAAVMALSPMLWETTVRFHILSSGGAAVALTAFVVSTLLLSLKHQSEILAWIAASAGVVTALALSMGTYNLLPFCAALLMMAATLEAAAFRDLHLGPRKLVAFAADFAVLWIVYVTSESKLPEAYQPIPEPWRWGIPCALLLIYGGGAAARTLVRHLDATFFEVFQLSIAFALFVYAATRGTGSHLPIGAALVLCGLACHWISFEWLLGAAQRRNLYVYSAFGFALTLLGTGLCLPLWAASIMWALAAAVFTFFAARGAGLVPALHALGFLAAAGLGSGLAWDTFSVLLRDATHVTLTSAALIAFAAMAGAYVFLQGLVPRTIVATMVAWVSAAWIGSLLLSVLPGRADAAWRADIRTILLIAAAVAVAAIGRHWQRPELYWLVPGAMAIALYRLISEDFRLGRPETLFVSLLFYGGALLLLSRSMRGWKHGGG